MTYEEFDHWNKVTAASKDGWQLDTIGVANHGRYLFYQGGENGGYVWVEPDGKVEIGTYTGAIPHIGEAFYRPIHSSKMGDNAQEALAKLESNLGDVTLPNSLAGLITLGIA